ncbi:MAG: aminotransferase class IV, partial [Deltaproteobacteria bacterium]|nr:aminotransferase class IV [Deltaproteobacteria bacterium]
DPHLDRFLRSAELARIPLPFPRERLRQIILETAAASGHVEGSVRYWLSAGPGGYGLGPGEFPGTVYSIRLRQRKNSIRIGHRHQLVDRRSRIFVPHFQ